MGKIGRISNTVNNSREREKTQSVNVAFLTLRGLIPTEPVDRKLSKIETLRLASSYISHLSSHILEEDEKEMSPNGIDFNRSNSHKICTFCLSENKKKSRTSSQIEVNSCNYTNFTPLFSYPDNYQQS